MSVTEIAKIADWAWVKRTQGELWRGRDSRFSIHRATMDAILGQEDGFSAFALYSVLVDVHGHTPGKHFSLSHAAMRETRLPGMGRPTFIRARDLLLELGLLRKVGGYVPRPMISRRPSVFTWSAPLRLDS